MTGCCSCCCSCCWRIWVQPTSREITHTHTHTLPIPLLLTRAPLTHIGAKQPPTCQHTLACVSLFVCMCMYMCVWGRRRRLSDSLSVLVFAAAAAHNKKLTVKTQAWQLLIIYEQHTYNIHTHTHKHSCECEYSGKNALKFAEMIRNSNEAEMSDKNNEIKIKWARKWQVKSKNKTMRQTHANHKQHTHTHAYKCKYSQYAKKY